MNQYANDFTRTTQTYFEELKKYKPMTKAREKRLLKRCKKGNIKARNEILESNLRFVFDIAKHYTGRGISISDLISEGNIGLLRAIDKFDEERDVKFISYAVWWIRQAMTDAIRRNNLINFVEMEQNEDNGSSIEKSFMDDEEDEEPSKDKFSNENEERAKERNENQKIVLSELMSVLSDRERDIVESYYGINDKKELTLTDIGKIHNISVERTRQIKDNSIKKLRSKILLCENFEELLS